MSLLLVAMNTVTAHILLLVRCLALAGSADSSGRITILLRMVQQAKLDQARQP